MPIETTSDYLVWKAQYALGHDTIDQQHRQIVAILNRLYESIRESTEEDQTGPILDDLCQYADTHFAYEEAVMAEIGYPDLAAHRRRHAEWKPEAQRFRARFERDGGAVGHDIFVMVRKWWLGHIQGEDRLFVPYLPS